MDKILIPNVSVRKMYQIDANNFIMILLVHLPYLYIYIYIYDARSHLHQIRKYY